MCNSLFDLFCCCFTRSEKKATTTKKDKKGRKHGKERKARDKYGTEWEENILHTPMSPSQIEDSMVTKDITVDKKLYENQEALTEHVLQDKYELNELLGSGSYGEVYKVREKVSGEFRAVKIMRLKDELDQSRNKFDLFRNEVFSLRKNPHKNIIKLYEHFMVSDVISFMVMEFADGGNLLDRLNEFNGINDRGFPEKESKDYFVQMANAMSFVHSNGLIHGDLKLDNVLIAKLKDGTEVIKVSDFGCARVVFKQGETALKKTKKAFGTLGYMAPEQIRVYITVNLNRLDLIKHPNYRYNPMQSDVWALGVCLYRLLFYDFPFKVHFPDYPTVQQQCESCLKMLDLMKKKLDAPQMIVSETSKQCLDLLSELLEYHKIKRIDMQIVMKHQWISDSPLLDRTLVK